MRLDETVAAAQRWAAIEERAFEVLGGWARSTSSPALKVLLAEQSRHHGWRAGLWRELVSSDYELGRSVTTAAMVDADADDDAGRREQAIEVVQGLLDDYRAALATASPVSDRPVIRALRRAIADIELDLAAIASRS